MDENWQVVPQRIELWSFTLCTYNIIAIMAPVWPLRGLASAHSMTVQMFKS